MQEVFEKIFEKLSNLGWVFADYYPDGTNISRVSKKSVPYDEVIEIVKQEAEKFGADTNVGSNGWIPTSELLPDKGGHYLVTYHEWSNGDYLPKFDNTYVRRLHYQKSERFTGWNYPSCVDERAEADTNREVFAWRELPTPYQPKGVRTNCMHRHENGNCLVVGGFCTAVDDKYCKYQSKGE